MSTLYNFTVLSWQQFWLDPLGGAIDQVSVNIPLLFQVEGQKLGCPAPPAQSGYLILAGLL